MIEGIKAGADDYIAKSSDVEVLRARLHAQVRRKQFGDQLSFPALASAWRRCTG